MAGTQPGARGVALERGQPGVRGGLLTVLADAPPCGQFGHPQLQSGDSQSSQAEAPPPQTPEPGMGSPVHRVSMRDAWSGQVNPDIETERREQSFDVERLTNILDGGAQWTALRRHVEHIIHSNPELSNKDIYFMSQDKRYENAIRKRLHVHLIAQRLGWLDDGPEIAYSFRALAGDLGLGLHTVFMKALRSLGTEEQIAKWGKLCKDFQIITTYAQTELGHGTNLQGLETEATYDPATQEFVIHSPTLTATKWWPGDLGRSATHALVQAHLICSGARQGMHAFIVPIRSLRDHSPLPGITVGDIGPKMDFDHIDNGYLRLDHVRVPRENMLSRFAQVLPDGTYVKPGAAQSCYLPMVVMRVSLLHNEILPLLQKACVIATRYSVVRRQSHLRPGDPEAKILDFQTQQHKLFPQLAGAYAFQFTYFSLQQLFQQVYQAVLEQDFCLLPELHALSAGMKAMLSEACTHGAEVCRRACGGHGFSKLSGLPLLVTKVTASCTYEGENTVLYLQVARFLTQAQMSVGAGSHKSLPQSVAYLAASPALARCPAERAADFLCQDLYTAAWAHVATRSIKDSVRHLHTLMQAGTDKASAWNQTAVQLVQAAKAHCSYHIVKSFVQALQGLEKEPAIQQVLGRLCHLYALHSLLANSGDFLQDGFLSGAQVDMARAAYLDLLGLIRKDAVLLVDAFDFTDQCLNSALGCYDGNAYQRLWEWTQRLPANTQENPAYEKHLRPLLQGCLAKL